MQKKYCHQRQTFFSDDTVHIFANKYYSFQYSSFHTKPWICTRGVSLSQMACAIEFPPIARKFGKQSKNLEQEMFDSYLHILVTATSSNFEKRMMLKSLPSTTHREISVLSHSTFKYIFLVPPDQEKSDHDTEIFVGIWFPEMRV